MRSMAEGRLIRHTPRRKESASVPHRRDAPVAGLLRDSIVGITCFPEPLPRGGKRGAGRSWRRAKRP